MIIAIIAISVIVVFVTLVVVLVKMAMKRENEVRENGLVVDGIVVSSERIAITLVMREERIALMSAALAPVSAEMIPVKISEIPCMEDISPLRMVSITLLKAVVIDSESKPRLAIV